MKLNNKGFTLIELLAVIVILGVLLMIAVPAIQNVIKKSKKNAFESQAKLIIENGIVFWPYLLIVLSCLFLSIYGFYSFFTLY